MLIPVFFGIYFVLFGHVFCAQSESDCPAPQASVYFRGYGTCIDKCPYINVDKDHTSIFCYCKDNSNCEHLNAVCNNETEECECSPSFTFVHQGFTCLPIRKIGEKCEVDDQCGDLVCNRLNGKCCFDADADVWIEEFTTEESTKLDQCVPRQELLAPCPKGDECYQPHSVCATVQDNFICMCEETGTELIVYDPQKKVICGYEGRVFTITCTRQDFEICSAEGIYSKCEYGIISGKQVLQRCVYPDSELTRSKQGKSGSCAKEDQFGDLWSAENGDIVFKPCPFGNSSFNAYWSCKDGNFVGKTPNYEQCENVWLEGLEKNITDKLRIEFHEAISQSEKILEEIRSENATYYGHEIKRISNLIDTVITKLIPTKEDCCNLSQKLATQIVGVTTGLFKMEGPWAQLQNNTEKHQTLSVVLSTLSDQTLKAVQKGCLESYANASSCEFEFPQNNVEVGSFESEVFSSGIFPSGGEHIPGRDTFIQFPHMENTSNYIGAIIENKYAVEYSRNETGDEKGVNVNGKYFNPDYEPNGDVVVFSISQDLNKTSYEPVQLKENVTITIQHSKYSFGSEVRKIHRRLHPGEQPSAVMDSARCGYWDVKNLNWSFAGCTVVSKTPYSTVCSCDHLSSISLVQTIIEYIGKSTVVVFCVIFFFCLMGFYLLFNIVAYLQPDEEHNTRKNPIVKFSGLLLTLFSYVVVVFFVDKHFFPFGQIGCYRIGIVAHFLILMFTFVMILESLKQTVDIACIQKLKFIVNLSQTHPNLFSLGVPFGATLVIVVSTVLWDIWDGPNSRAYGGEFCWLDGEFIYALFIPMWISLATNYFVLGIVIRKIIRMVKGRVPSSESLTGEVLSINDITSFAKKGITSNSLVLITWLVGFFTCGPKYLGYKYMDGVFAFLLIVQGYLVNKLLDKDKYVDKFKQKIIRHFMRKLLNSDKTNQETTSARNESKSSEELPMIAKKETAKEAAHTNLPSKFDPSKKGGVKVYPPFNINKND